MVQLAQRRLDRAGEALREALEIRRRVLAPGHADTADTLLGLGLLALHGGDPAPARTNLAEALAIYERRVGADNPRTQAARAHLATC